MARQIYKNEKKNSLERWQLQTCFLLLLPNKGKSSTRKNKIMQHSVNRRGEKRFFQKYFQNICIPCLQHWRYPNSQKLKIKNKTILFTKNVCDFFFSFLSAHAILYYINTSPLLCNILSIFFQFFFSFYQFCISKFQWTIWISQIGEEKLGEERKDLEEGKRKRSVGRIFRKNM